MNAVTLIASPEALSPELADHLQAEALGAPQPANTLYDIIAALEAWAPEVARLQAIHSAADMAWVGKPEDEEALRDAEQAAHDAWCEARDVRERLVEDLLKLPVASTAEAVLKQEAAARFSEARGTNYKTVDPDMAQTALDAAIADLRSLGGGTPPPPAEGSQQSAAAAEIDRRMEAYQAAFAEAAAADEGVDEAETAAHDLRHAAPREWPPYAPILTVGRHTFTYRREVEEAALAPELKAQMLDALAERDRVIAAEDEASGLAALDRAVEAARKRQSEAWNNAVDLALDVVDAPAGSRADIMRQLAFAQKAFDECCVDDGSQIETYRRLASQAAVLAPPDTSAWNKAMTEVERLQREERKLDAEATAAYERLEARAGEMPDKGCLWENGEKKRALRRLDLERGSDFATHLTRLPPSEAAAIREAVNAYWDEYDRIAAEEGGDRLTEKADAAAVLTSGARQLIYPLRAPSLPALLEKLAAYCEHDSPAKLIRFAESDEVARALSEGSDGAMFVHLYRDIAALCGAHDPTMGVEAFDAKAWVEAFEAHPGHEIMFNGKPAYMDEAFPLPTDEELTITEPAILEALEQYYRDHSPDHAAERLAEGKTNTPVNMKYHGKVLDWAFTNHPAEHAHYSAVWQRYLDARKAEPAGAAAWKALTYWQRNLVKAYAKERDEAGRKSSHGEGAKGGEA